MSKAKSSLCFLPAIKRWGVLCRERVARLGDLVMVRKNGQALVQTYTGQRYAALIQLLPQPRKKRR